MVSGSMEVINVFTINLLMVLVSYYAYIDDLLIFSTNLDIL